MDNIVNLKAAGSLIKSMSQWMQRELVFGKLRNWMLFECTVWARHPRRRWVSSSSSSCRRWWERMKVVAARLPNLNLIREKRSHCWNTAAVCNHSFILSSRASSLQIIYSHCKTLCQMAWWSVFEEAKGGTFCWVLPAH